MRNLKSNIIETERLLLRPLVLSDAGTAYNGRTGDADVAEWVEYIGGDEEPSESTPEELSEAMRSITSTLSKCEKSLTKLRVGTPQYTLTDRRIKAFRIAIDLIEKEMESIIK